MFLPEVMNLKRLPNVAAFVPVLCSGALNSAISLLQEATKEVPQNPNYVYHLGLAYQKIKDRSHAKSYLQRALDLNPRSERAREIRQALAEVSDVSINLPNSRCPNMFAPARKLPQIYW